MSSPPPWWRPRSPYLPAVGAVLTVWLSLTPSLLPRPALFQGLLCGIAAALGYGLGALAGWVVRSLGGHLVGRRRRLAWTSLAVVGAVGTVVVLLRYLGWQRDLREAVGQDAIGFGHLTVVAVMGVVIFSVVLALARLVRAGGRWSGRQIGRVLPAPAATVLGALVAAALVVMLVDDVVAARVVARLDATFMAINDEFSTDLPAPTNPHLTAGPGSLVAWEDLGRQGRVFIDNAPTPETISAFSGRDARQPVRAYVGVGTDGEIDLREEARLAVAELERTGGLERQVVNVATGTGRGWVNENQVRALEYMWDGDTATVSMQYSYLPSWMSFIVDVQRAQDAGRFLFEAVFERVQELPEESRPLLVVSGESLGSFGGEAAFSGAQDLAERADGALFVGPTGDNHLWRQVTDERDPGSPEVLPVVDGGAGVRFADQPEDWAEPSPSWEGPRLGYLQHANDPVTWWTWSLAWRKPDWLSEPRGRAVLPQTRWIPVVTMLQVAADQMVANAVPPGQGHDFGQAPVHAWASILPPPGWDPQQTERLVQEIRSQRVKDVA